MKKSMPLLDKAGLYVIEKDKKFVYNRLYDNNGVPNYYPPVDKSKLYSDMNVDEIMFFPIDPDTYQTDRKHKFYAYRYLFCTNGHTTISLGEDPHQLGWTYIQIQIEVRRIRYMINQEGEIVIDKICDSIYPTRVIQLKDRSTNIGYTIQETILSEVTKFNNWYRDKTV